MQAAARKEPLGALEEIGAAAKARPARKPSGPRGLGGGADALSACGVPSTRKGDAFRRLSSALASASRAKSSARSDLDARTDDELAILWQDHLCAPARDLLLARMEGLLIHEASRRGWIETDDALQQGRLAILRAIDRYDRTIAGSSVHTAIFYLLKEELNRIGTRRSMISGVNCRLLKTWRSAMRASGGDAEAAFAATARKENLSVEHVRMAVHADSVQMVSLSGTCEEEDAPFDVADAGAPSETHLVERMDLERALAALNAALGELCEKERLVLRGALDGKTDRVLSEILGITTSRVQQIRARALPKVVAKIPMGGWHALPDGFRLVLPR